MKKTDWFESWFDSPYYPLLYDHRNEAEAENFIRFLANKIPIQKHETWVDLACGRGRHANFVQQFCNKVYGIDLSPKSIEDAKKYESEHLHFQVDDMRSFQLPTLADGFLNLFTSFGYFQQSSDNLLVLKQIHSFLKPNGILVIDFLNEAKVRSELIEYQEITKNNIHFKISKTIKESKVCKKIEILDGDKNYTFEESVQLFNLEDFSQMLNSCQFTISEYWGDYEGSTFTEKSPRLVILATKNV